ncbi:hypothetical protein CHI14_15945 [Paenibacillus sp. 7516]|nr:hypothetical protein CHI14_15945 [Paenibacillus sp. 7516]
MPVLLVVTAAAFSIMLGREIYIVLDIRKRLQESEHFQPEETGNDFIHDFVKSSNLELRRRLRDIAVLTVGLLVIYVIANILQSQLITESDIDLTYRYL